VDTKDDRADDRPTAKLIPPDFANKKTNASSDAGNPPFSSPCLLGEDEDFDPNYLPSYLPNDQPNHPPNNSQDKK
jgi:hypothetical protein